MSAASDARNERARALGFTSYSQQYRASKVGYVGQGHEYNAVVHRSKFGGAVVRIKAGRGRVVLSAERGDFKKLMSAIRRELR